VLASSLRLAAQARHVAKHTARLPTFAAVLQTPTTVGNAKPALFATISQVLQRSEQATELNCLFCSVAPQTPILGPVYLRHFLWLLASTIIARSGFGAYPVLLLRARTVAVRDSLDEREARVDPILTRSKLSLLRSTKSTPSLHGRTFGQRRGIEVSIGTARAVVVWIRDRHGASQVGGKRY
jgi:hypothetical protein